MSIFYYDPFADFDRLFDEAFTARTGNNNQVQRASNDNAVTSTRFLRPTMDLHDNKETNTITATFELPGVKKEDVQIDVQNNRLTVGAESNFSSEENKEKYVVKERRFGKFSRTLQLPQGVKNEDIKASLENGVLTVTFPKTTPETAPKKIAIN